MAKAKKKPGTADGVGRPVVGVDLRRGLVQLRDAEGVDAGDGVVMEVQEQDAEQHQHRTSQRVEEELDGGVELARAAPDADQQVHRDQHRFPEHEEQEEIERHEDAQHAGLQNQKPDVVFLHALLDRGPRREDRDPSQQRGQHDQQERDAVDAEVIPAPMVGIQLLGAPSMNLKPRLEALRPEQRHQRKRDQEAAQREDVRDPADRRPCSPWERTGAERAQQRREQDDRENVILHKGSSQSLELCSCELRAISP